MRVLVRVFFFGGGADCCVFVKTTVDFIVSGGRGADDCSRHVHATVLDHETIPRLFVCPSTALPVAPLFSRCERTTRRAWLVRKSGCWGLAAATCCSRSGRRLTAPTSSSLTSRRKGEIVVKEMGRGEKGGGGGFYFLRCAGDRCQTPPCFFFV